MRWNTLRSESACAAGNEAPRRNFRSSFCEKIIEKRKKQRNRETAHPPRGARRTHIVTMMTHHTRASATRFSSLSQRRQSIAAETSEQFPTRGRFDKRTQTGACMWVGGEGWYCTPGPRPAGRAGTCPSQLPAGTPRSRSQRSGAPSRGSPRARARRLRAGRLRQRPRLRRAAGPWVAVMEPPVRQRQWRLQRRQR